MAYGVFAIVGIMTCWLCSMPLVIVHTTMKLSTSGFKTSIPDMDKTLFEGPIGFYSLLWHFTESVKSPKDDYQNQHDPPEVPTNTTLWLLLLSLPISITSPPSHVPCRSRPVHAIMVRHHYPLFIERNYLNS